MRPIPAGSVRTYVLLLVLSPALPGCGPGDEASLRPAVPHPEARTGRQVVENSIAHHDPRGSWGRKPLHLVLVNRPADEPTAARIGSAWPFLEQRVVIDAPQDRFEIAYVRGGAEIAIRFEGTAASVTVDGRSDLTAEELARHGVARIEGVRDYHEYLLGLPMKLSDPGTRVGPEVREVDFRGRSALEVKVEYDPEVGSDVWRFFFDRASYALLGARVVHEGNDAVGENLVFEGEAGEPGGLRLPRERRWHFFHPGNEEGTFLALDEVAELRVMNAGEMIPPQARGHPRSETERDPTP